MVFSYRSLPHAGKACIGAMPESSILVTSRFYDTRERIVSHVWCQIVRLSPHLFWLGLFTHGSFSSAQDDDTRGRKGSHLGDTLHVLELAVLYYDTSRPLEKGRAEGAGWICPAGASFYAADNVLLAGIVSHAWHEILRLSPHLFWLGGSHIERFRPLRMTIREGGRVLIWEICCVFWN